jgi:hypothetical protein
MKREDDIRKQKVPSEKTLAMSDGSGSANAHCISSYGAFQAVSMLSPTGIREVFSDTNPRELIEIADGVDENIKDKMPFKDEAAVKDLAFKREVLLWMAEENSECDIVTENPDGRFSVDRD